MSSNFMVLPSEHGEENPVRPPKATRNARGQHRWNPAIVDNKAVGYERVVYEHQEYPKVLYHPKYGIEPKPEEAKFAVGAVTVEQLQNAAKAYIEAINKWNRSNRTTEAKSREDEERLVKKGWTLTPPKPKPAEKFDLASEEV